MPVAAPIAAGAIGAGGSIIAGNQSAKAAERAAELQYQAAMQAAKVQREALGFQKEVYQQGRDDAMPWLDAGREALGQYRVEMGLQPGESKFQATPGYQFAVEQGERGVLGNLSALGMKNSGAALKALTRFRDGLANQEFGNYLARLSGLAGTGQNQLQSTSALGANTAASMSAGANALGNTIQNAGAARASGYVGSANAWGNAIGGATNNISGALGMMSQTPRANTLGAGYYSATPGPW